MKKKYKSKMKILFIKKIPFYYIPSHIIGRASRRELYQKNLLLREPLTRVGIPKDLV